MIIKQGYFRIVYFLPFIIFKIYSVYQLRAIASILSLLIILFNKKVIPDCTRPNNLGILEA